MGTETELIGSIAKTTIVGGIALKSMELLSSKKKRKSKKFKNLVNWKKT